MEILQGINGVSREALSLTAQHHILTEALPPRLITVGRDAMGVGCFHHTGNGSAIPGLYCTDQGCQAIEIIVINVDETTWPNEVELVAFLTKFSCQFPVL